MHDIQTRFRLGKQNDFECGTVVGERRACLSILGTGNLFWDFPTKPGTDLKKRKFQRNSNSNNLLLQSRHEDEHL